MLESNKFQVLSVLSILEIIYESSTALNYMKLSYVFGRLLLHMNSILNNAGNTFFVSTIPYDFAQFPHWSRTTTADIEAVDRR